MKKKISILILAALAVAAIALCFTGCGNADYTSSPSTQIFKAQDMKNKLESFLGNGERADRTSQTSAAETDGADGESKAAEWLYAELTSTLGEGNAELQAFERTTAYGDTFHSQNVIGRIKAADGKNTEGYKIVIGANYDNKYATVKVSSEQYSRLNYAYFEGSGAEAAMDNGTGVATVLALADYFAAEQVRSQLAFDIDFVFYGMGSVDYYGSYNYLNKLSEAGRSRLLLAVNIERLGGDKLYAYFDEVDTSHGKFILETAKQSGYNADYVSEPSNRQADYGARMTDSLPYTPPYVLSDVGQYFGQYNICAVTSGIDNGFFLGDRESGDNANISGTSDDTLKTLNEFYPDYAEQMAVSAEILAKSITRTGFTDALVESKNNIGSYAWLTVPWVAFTAVAVLSLGALVPIIIVVRKLERKYRENPEIKKNVKVAVFGMDFETPEENDVFIDIRSPETVDPFDDFDQPDVRRGDSPDNDGQDKRDDNDKN